MSKLRRDCGLLTSTRQKNEDHLSQVWSRPILSAARGEWGGGVAWKGANHAILCSQRRMLQPAQCHAGLLTDLCRNICETTNGASPHHTARQLANKATVRIVMKLP